MSMFATVFNSGTNLPSTSVLELFGCGGEGGDQMNPFSMIFSLLFSGTAVHIGSWLRPFLLLVYFLLVDASHSEC